MTIRLSNFDADLIRLIELQPDLPVSDLANTLSKKVHRIRYQIQRFEQLNILENVVPVLNPTKFGFQEFIIYISLNTPLSSMRTNFINTCKSIPTISWLTPCGGVYEYLLSVCTPDLSELKNILSLISEKCGPVLREKTISRLTEFTFFGRKYLSPRLKLPPLHYGAKPPEVKIDHIDRRILTSLQSNPSRSLRELARFSESSLATVTRRIAQLQEKLILVGKCRRIATSALGYQSYRVLFQLADLSTSFYQSFFRHAEQHYHVVSLLRYDGTWDIDVRLEFPVNQNPSLFTQEVEELFPRSIARTAIIPLYKPIVIRNVPFNDMPL